MIEQRGELMKVGSGNGKVSLWNLDATDTQDLKQNDLVLVLDQVMISSVGAANIPLPNPLPMIVVATRLGVGLIRPAVLIKL